MRRASPNPLAACENTTKAGDGRWADPYSEPSIFIESLFRVSRLKRQANFLFQDLIQIRLVRTSDEKL